MKRSLRSAGRRLLMFRMIESGSFGYKQSGSLIVKMFHSSFQFSGREKETPVSVREAFISGSLVISCRCLLF